MPLVTTAMYEVICLSGLVGTIARVRPVASDGALATTNSCGEASSRWMPVTPPPGPLSETSNIRTVCPPTNVVGSIGCENVIDHGALVLKPSNAFNATWGSAKLFGLATGIFRVRSVLPVSSRLFGNGTTPSAGSKFATVWNGTGAV